MSFQPPLKFSVCFFVVILFCLDTVESQAAPSKSESSTSIKAFPVPPRSPTLNARRSAHPLRPNSGEGFVESIRYNITNLKDEGNYPATNSTDNLTATNLVGRKEEPYVGIRIRFNEPFFEETARLFYTVFSHEVQKIKIIPQRQCFQEGCFNLHTFRITGFQRPKGISLRPLSPNLLLLNIFAFDVDIMGLLNGNVQLLLTAVPVSGNIVVGSRQLSITATFDLQKNQLKVPFLRMQSCELRSGFVNTHVSDLGLLTDSINLKYKTEMVTKSKEMITSTICNQIEQTIRAQVNERLRQMPRHISVARILSVFSKEDECRPFTSLLCGNNQQAASTAVETIRPDMRLTPKFYDYLHSQNYPSVQQWTQTRRWKRRSHNSQSHAQFQANRNTASTSNLTVAQEQRDNDRGIATISEIIPEMEEEEEADSEQMPQISLKQGEPKVNKRHYVITSFHPKQTLLLVNNSEEALKKHSYVVSEKQHQPSFHDRQQPEKKSSNNTDSENNGEKSGIFRRPDNILEVKEQVGNQKNRQDLKKGTQSNETIKEESKGTFVVNKEMGNLGVLLEFLDLSSLGRIFIDLDFLDSSAGSDSFGVGINGDVFLKSPQPVTYVGGGVREVLTLASKGKRRKDNASQTTSFSSDKEIQEDEKEIRAKNGRVESTPEKNLDLKDMLELLQPPKLKFPNSSTKGLDGSLNPPKKTLEMIFSELQPNLVLLQAHRARLLKVRLGPGLPFFGNLLKTTCSVDEVCLSDSIPEAGERYPNKLLEVQLETVRPPKISVTKDLAKLSFIGSATFYLADGTHQPIGRIPFTTTIQVAVKMFRPDSPRLDVALNITKLEILQDVDFFELSTETLKGFSNAIKGAIENTAKKVLEGGVDTRPLARKLNRYGLSKLGLSLLNGGLILLQADVDVYKLVFEEEEPAETANNVNFGQFQPPFTSPGFG